MTQKNTLFDLTTNLLKSPSTFKSTEFITVYNHIYQHCTSPTLRYEIKGREIYNTLLDIINSFTSKIVHYENIQDLHSILHNYENAILLLKKVYHYLERFFITVSIDKRDGYVMDIKTLCYTSIYHNYIEKTELKIFELLIFEIDNFKSTKSEKIEYVRHVIEILKKVYTSNDEDRKFKNFVKSYISNISNKIRNKNSLQDSMDYLFKKIKLTNMIFDRYFVVNIRKKLIKSIIKRRNELIELVIERIMTNSNVKDYFNCILVLECRSMFEEAYDKMVHSNVDVFINSNESDEDTLNKIILFYEHVYGKIIKECGKDQVLLRILDKEYLKIDFVKYADSIYSIHDDEMKKQNSHTKIVTLTTFINMINDTRAQDILLYDFQYRLMTNNYNYKFEKYYIECLNKTKYFSLVNKLNRCLRDVNLHKNYFVCQLEKYGEVDIEYRLLTNGFWMLNTQDIMINKTITMLENKIKDKLNDRLLDKVIGFNYTNSAIVIEFNGYEIQLCTLDYLVFDTVNNEREITIEKVNAILKCDCKASIKRLQENMLVICENDMYRTNREYNNGDLSIFGIELNELQCKKKPKCKHELVQTKILRILKNERKMTRDKIVNYMGEAYMKDFEEALDELIGKSKIICTGDICTLTTEKD